MIPRIILVHGLGAHQDRWTFLENYCRKHKIQTTALNIPATLPLVEWLDVIAEKHAALLKANKNQPIYICGESLGGLMAYRYAQKPKTKPCAGLILISPAFKSKLQFSIWEYGAIVLGSIFPFFKIKAHFSAAMCTSDTSYQKSMQASKKETRSFSPRLFIAIAWQQILATIMTPPKLRTIMLLAGQDVMVDTQTSIRIAQKRKYTYKVYPQMRHALSIEKERVTVFRDIVAWIQGA